MHSFRQRSRQHIAEKTSYALLRKGLIGSKKVDQYKHTTLAILEIKNPHLFERLSIFSKLFLLGGSYLTILFFLAAKVYH